MRAPAIALLLFGSGLCALVYQIAWMRELRLVFGASTAASAAVVALFIGGLGIGSRWLGPRADRHPRPLLFYARLEAGVALAAAVTPLTVWLAREAYTALGGSIALGLGGATALRLGLAAAILVPPTVLMGGTLPAAARAIASDDDAGRRRVGLAYGANTIGAVTGAMIATFAALEALGTRATLWSAAALNLMIAATAAWLAVRGPESAADPDEADAHPARGAPAVLGAAAIVGFAFFLMEIVWYRMLGPLLGGTVFTFGLILAVALAGIGAGAAVYAAGSRRRRVRTVHFAWTCALQAIAVALPLALGDRIAVLTLLLQPVAATGFGAQIAVWSFVAAVVVFPAAFLAGVQFPTLIALLGSGRRAVGRAVALAYAWNTAGAVAGAIAGGFGLIPALGAVGCWRAAAAVLALLAAAAVVVAWREQARLPALAAPAACALAGLALLAAPGPTAVWRSSGIGAGRAELPSIDAPSDLRNWQNGRRAAVLWEVDGIESAVALNVLDGYSMFVNGKSDGNARYDAPTTVMFGLIGAALHPAPRQALVIGLGTGTTAGWLAAIPEIERVDVIELEPAIERIAAACAAVNREALSNAKVHLRYADAREVLLASAAERYDVIASEPSNPYRAGVASLFTREFYGAVAERLTPNGIFAQWMQAYEVDSRTVKSVYATLAAVFPHVETWQVGVSDLLFVAAREPVAWDADVLTARLAREPYRTALLLTWRATSLEAVLAHYVASPGFAAAVAREAGVEPNRDDRNLIEFGAARTVGRRSGFAISQVRAAARAQQQHRPSLADGSVNWDEVDDAIRDIGLVEGERPELAPFLGRDARRRAETFSHWFDAELAEARASWSRQPRTPKTPNELGVLGEALADAGDAGALELCARLRGWFPIEADAIAARYHYRQGDMPAATAALEAAFVAWRRDPWALRPIMRRAIGLAMDVGRRDRAAAVRLFAALAEPFAVSSANAYRLEARLVLGALLGPPACVEAFAAVEPHVPWDREALQHRASCYAGAQHSMRERAERDLAELSRQMPAPFLAP